MGQSIIKSCARMRCRPFGQTSLLVNIRKHLKRPISGNILALPVDIGVSMGQEMANTTSQMATHPRQTLPKQTTMLLSQTAMLPSQTMMLLMLQSQMLLSQTMMLLLPPSQTHPSQTPPVQMPKRPRQTSRVARRST